MNSRQLTSLASQTLKLVGFLLIFSSVIDFLILPFPYQFLNREWRLGVVTQLVDRGIIPMIGIALLFLGFWLLRPEDGSSSPQNPKPAIAAINIFASVLGLFYLLLVPLHLSDINRQSAQAIEQIGTQAQDAETQLGSEQFAAQLEQQQEQLRLQISTLIQDETRLQQAVEQGVIPQEQLERIEQFKQDPTALDTFLDAQAQNFRNEQLTRVKERREELQKQTGTNALKSSVRIGFSSLLLAIGYIIIGWTGLKQMQPPRPPRSSLASR